FLFARFRWVRRKHSLCVWVQLPPGSATAARIGNFHYHGSYENLSVHVPAKGGCPMSRARLTVALLALGVLSGAGVAAAQEPSADAAVCAAPAPQFPDLTFVQPLPRIEHCTQTVQCPGGGVASCSGLDCWIIWNCASNADCGVVCYPTGIIHYCQGYTAANCNCGV